MTQPSLFDVATLDTWVWHRHAGPRWHPAKATSVRAHVDVLGIELGGRVVATMMSQRVAWNVLGDLRHTL